MAVCRTPAAVSIPLAFPLTLLELFNLVGPAFFAGETEACNGNLTGSVTESMLARNRNTV